MSYHYFKEDIHSGMTSISFCYSLILKHSGLCQIIEALKTFISNKKEAVLISAMSSIKFVKKELKSLAKRVLQLAFSIMHQTGSFELPVHIAFTQLRPEISIFSNSLRKVILIELTSFVKKTWNPGTVLRSTSI